MLRKFTAKYNDYLIFDDVKESFEQEKNILSYTFFLDLDVDVTWQKESCSVVVQTIARKALKNCFDLFKRVFSTGAAINPIDNPLVDKIINGIGDHCIIASLYTAQALFLNGEVINTGALYERYTNWGFWTLCDKNVISLESFDFKASKVKDIIQPLDYHRSTFSKRNISFMAENDSIFKDLVPLFKGGSVNRPVYQLPAFMSDFSYEI